MHWLRVWVAVVLAVPTVMAAPARNLIVMVPDGTASAHYAVARWLNGKPLAADGILTGAMRTHSAESLITDSAAAATAFACGYKTNTGFVGVSAASVTMPDIPASARNEPVIPVASVLEAAKSSGRRVGIVATSNVQHATPACYCAHTWYRNDYNAIAEQQVYLGLNVVFGGGRAYMLPGTAGGTRTDGSDLLQVLRERGATVIENREQLATAAGEQVWGLFAPYALAYDLDRSTQAATQPSLAEMTKRAIELLDAGPNGFFLMVEGSKIDWASHANDPVGVATDLLAFDDALAAALEFARGDGETLVVSFSDHANGGMSIGDRSTDSTYAGLPAERLVAPLRRARLTGEGLEQVLGGRDEASIRAALDEYWGITDLELPEIREIQQAGAGKLNYVVGPIISRRAAIGWTTHGHTGADTMVHAFGPGRPTGLIDNAAMARICAEALGVDLAAAQRDRFVELSGALPGAAMTVDWTRPDNPLVSIAAGGRSLVVEPDTDLLRVDGKTERMDGVAVLMVRRYLQQRHDGRIYVLGTPAAIRSGLAGHPPEIGRAVTRIGVGPDGETVVVEAGKTPFLDQRLFAAFRDGSGSRERERLFLPRTAIERLRRLLRLS